MARVILTLKDSKKDGVDGVDVAMVFDEEADAENPTLSEQLAIYLLDKIAEVTKDLDVIGTPFEPLNKDPDPTLN